MFNLLRQEEPCHSVLSTRHNELGVAELRLALGRDPPLRYGLVRAAALRTLRVPKACALRTGSDPVSRGPGLRPVGGVRSAPPPWVLPASPPGPRPAERAEVAGLRPRAHQRPKATPSRAHRIRSGELHKLPLLELLLHRILLHHLDLHSLRGERARNGAHDSKELGGAVQFGEDTPALRPPGLE